MPMASAAPRFDILARCGSRISRDLQAGLKSRQIASDATEIRLGPGSGYIARLPKRGHQGNEERKPLK
jgi:hypothetical protein